MTKQNWKPRRPLFASPVRKTVKKPKLYGRAFPILWLAIKRTCFVLGAFMLISAVMMIVISASLVGSQSAVLALPQEMVLFLHFEDELRERPYEGGFSDPFALAPPTVQEMVDAIDHAAADPKVKGILARLDQGSFSIAHVQELRAALERYKQTGKFLKMYSPSYGGAGGGLGRFYLASAFEERWMQPLGVVSIPGINAEMPYLRGMLDKIGVTPHFYQRKEYKNAYENLTDRKMSPKSRESLQSVIDSIRDEIVKDVSADLDMTQNKLVSLVDRGLFTAEEALAEKLITHMDYMDVLADQIKVEITGDADTPNENVFVTVSQYLQARSKGQNALHRHKKKPGVAAVYAVGAIMDEGGAVAAADEIVPAIMEATEDEAIQAIVLRVDSPGGSPLASERILHALKRAQKEGKSVIVSMGPTAASGGYWIAASADRIFTMPTTLTGSIGVVGGKFSVGGLSEKIGVNWDGIAWGENAGMWSLHSGFSQSESARVNAMLDQVYDAFIMRVAQGRGMSPEAVDKVARGRVWSGAKAVEIGLADEFGGLSAALDYTAVQLGAEDRRGVEIVVLPRPKTAFEQLIELMEEQGSIYEGLKIQAALGRLLRPALEQASILDGSGFSAYEPLQIQ